MIKLWKRDTQYYRALYFCTAIAFGKRCAIKTVLVELWKASIHERKGAI